MSERNLVRYRREGRIARLTLNRPGRLNAISLATPPADMWVYRLGPEKAKRMLFTGDMVNGKEAVAMGLVLEAVPAEELTGESTPSPRVSPAFREPS